MHRRKSAAADGLAGANDDTADDFAFLHGAIRGGFLDVGGDDIADASMEGFLADNADHGGAAGTGIVGDINPGANLYHGGISV